MTDKIKDDVIEEEVAEETQTIEVSTGSNGAKPEERPVFDWPNISHKWAREFSRVASSAINDALITQSKADDDASPAEKHKFMVAQAVALESMNDSADNHDEMLAQIIVSVPQSWLVDGAGEGLAGLDLLDAVRQDKIGSIMESYREQQRAAAENTKN